MITEDFVRESNAIEGILREPTVEELMAHQRILDLSTITLADLVEFVSVVQPGARLRDQTGLDVRVGPHIPPRGGPQIREALLQLLNSLETAHPYTFHQAYETLHPFTDGNGRSGRVLWARAVRGSGILSKLGFLHAWYYQSLQHNRS